MRLRRSRIYIPGNNPRMIETCGLFEADVITLDLEDSVSLEQKLDARMLVSEGLKDLNFGRSEITIRINSLNNSGKEDLKEIIPTGKVDAIYLPKTEKADDIKELERILDELEQEKGKTKIVPILESAKGVLNAYEIAKSSSRLIALSFGGEDYTRDLGGERTREGYELFYARSRVVMCAKAAGVQALDTVHSDISDMDGLKENCLRIKHMGFDGKAAIHPSQIPVIHEAFNPTQEEIEYAKKVIECAEEAKRKGLGAIALGRKMIDKPVLEKAYRVIEIAKLAGLEGEK
jgi:citrate lyase subunit beta/citryl-CoA lyase